MRAIDVARAERIRELLALGTPYRLICAEVGCTKATVSHYAARMGLAKSTRKHDCPAIRVFYEAGHSGHAARRAFDIPAGTWQLAIKRGEIIPRAARAHVRAISEVLTAPSVCRTHLRKRLVREGLLAVDRHEE